MTRTRIAALAGALAVATILTGAGWLGYQQWAATPIETESLTTYDPDDPAEVSQTADDVFTATVLGAEDHRRIDGFDWDVYPVRVDTTHKGTVRGDLQVAVENSSTELKAGHSYVFATFSFADPHGMHGQVTETTPQPATEQTVRTWHRATSH
ncbi:hypothetical protein GTY65_00045 [Streptomyces sp. SID8379]|uniref:hypothetical protein n=1 Tax=unclassified Streptomyces TaxID=2593676 RepID=UPI00037D5CBC|nr:MULTISPECIES: hypothetical protein [unclassified Streptomyces]MYW62484.1 hypothetical protein [Streptomyces sp. SID8379]